MMPSEGGSPYRPRLNPLPFTLPIDESRCIPSGICLALRPGRSTDQPGMVYQASSGSTKPIALYGFQHLYRVPPVPSQ